MYVTYKKIECIHEIYFMNCILNQIIQLSITVKGKILLRFYSVHNFSKLLIQSSRELSDFSEKPLLYTISSKIFVILFLLP